MNPRVPLLLLLALPIQAATNFTGAVSTDFNDVLNWDNGLPSGGNNGTVTMPADMTADFNTTTGINYDLTINSTLTTGAHELQHRSGSNGRDVYVGSGSGNTGALIVSDGGTLDIAGTGSDLFIAFGGASGSVVVEDGGTFSASKTIDIGTGGSLSFGAGALMLGTAADELQLRNGSTLQYEIAADGSHFTLAGSTLEVRLGSNPDLIVNFLAAPVTGSSFELISGASGFFNYLGSAPNTFDPAHVTVTGLGAGQAATLDYTTSLTLVIVPEPGFALLGSLGLLGLLRRRR